MAVLRPPPGERPQHGARAWPCSRQDLAQPRQGRVRGSKAYGVLHMLGFAKRHTIYIGMDGRVLKVDTDVRPATSAEDMVATLAELGIERRGK